MANIDRNFQDDPELRDAPRIERLLFMAHDFRCAETGKKLSYSEIKERAARTDYRRNRGRDRY